MYNFLLVFHYKSRSFEFTLFSSACIIVSSRTVSEIFNASNNGTSLKSELEVIQGHCKWQNSIKHITWFLISLPLYVACLGGAVGSVTVRAAWLRWSASPGSRPGLARSLSGYSGICFEIKFSGRHRGFDSVLFNLWPLANTGFRDTQY